MAVTTDAFSEWLARAQIPERRLTPERCGLLRAAFHFRLSRGDDYYSTRLLSHFLLHCDAGLKVAQLARLVGVSRPTASRQQGLSSKEAVQQAHHRMDGRPYGKLLPRFVGPIAGFVCGHPDASRADLIDFIDRTFGVRVSRIALYKFLKKYGLDHVAAPPPVGNPTVAGDAADKVDAAPAALPAATLAAAPAPPFCAAVRNTPAPS